MADQTVESISPRRASGLPKAPPDGLVAAALLAFLATAGLFYVNIMAAIVDGLVAGLGLTEQQAGLIGSANIYGASIGALFAVLIVKQVPWRPLAYLLLCSLIVLDVVSIFVSSGDTLLPIRFIHGVIGGLLTGLAFALIARTANPDRTFGMLLFVQFGLGGLGVMLLPPLAPVYGTSALFLALVAFSVVTLIMVSFLDTYPADRKAKLDQVKAVIQWPPLILTFAAIFAFQAANMALLAYIIRLGLGYGLEREYVSIALGLSTWVALLGPFLVMVCGLKFGRGWLLLASMILTLVGTSIFHLSGAPWAYIVANCGTGITWGFVIAYLLGMTAEFDEAGRASAFGGFVSKLGLASGPMMAGWILQAGLGFATLINVAVSVLFISMLIMLIPAFMLDARRRKEPTPELEPAT